MAYLFLRGEPLCPTGASTAAPAPIDAVLFDKDGTLSHSEPMLQALAQARVFQCLRLAAFPEGESERSSQLEDLLRKAYGLSDEGIHPAGTTAVAARDHNLISTATALAQVGLGWPDAVAIAEVAFALTDALHGEGGDHPPHPTAGILALLQRLRGVDVRCAVISNDHEQGIRTFLARHEVTDHFAAVWSAEHQPRKPDPGAVRGLCRDLGVTPERCALIGDANTDLRMARSAGVPVVLGYQAGWKRAPELDPEFPHLRHWDELQVIAAEANLRPGE
jgi:phosphoglycolate phosphatase